MAKRNWILVLLLIPGLLAALALLANRLDIESRNKSVELALDYAELQSLSAASGVPMPVLLERFKAAGVTGVAITEQLFGDLTATGQASLTERYSPETPLTVVRVQDSALRERLYRSLGERLPPETVLRVPEDFAPQASDEIVVKAAPLTLNGIGLGLQPEAVSIVRESGLDVVARLQNNPVLTVKAVDAAISEMRAAGVTRLICSGEEVLGFRGLIEAVAARLKSAGMAYGSVEFAKQRGDAGMCRRLDGFFIRVHSIPIPEMAALSANQATERFARAVKERNIRLCYVRLFEATGEDPVEANVRFVGGIHEALRSVGYSAGPAKPFDDRPRSSALTAVMGVSTAAGCILLLSSLITLSAAVQFVLLSALSALFVGLTLAGDFGMQMTALSVAVIFPTLGVFRVYGPYLGREISGSFRHPALRSTARFVRASAYTLAGALMIGGMLGTRDYMLKVEQFAGIKVAHLLPLLLVVLLMSAGLPMMNEALPVAWRRIRANLREVGASPLFIWQAMALLFAVGIIGFALLRTGNDPGVGVSGLELKFRAILDKVLVVRPRTKEFLIGHPALIMGAAFLFARRRTIGLPLLALGVLGQVSMLNTFCHIHTPLAVTIMRAFNGIVLGVLIALPVWWFVCKPIVRATAPSSRNDDGK